MTRERSNATDHALVVVAFRSDQPSIHRRVNAILALAEETDTTATAFARAVADLEGADLTHLAHFMGWRAVHDLNITPDRRDQEATSDDSHQ